MQNTGQGGEKRSYRVILLLVVGLAAFSNAMKELNQVQAFAAESSSLVAQWTEKLVPTERTITVETCENNQANVPQPPPVVVPALPPMPPPPVADVDSEAPRCPLQALPPTPPRVPASPVSNRRVVARPAHDAAEVRVLLSLEDLVDKSRVEKTFKAAFETDPSLKPLKAKNRRQIFITPDGKDVILKTLNRSINLRSAS